MAEPCVSRRLCVRICQCGIRNADEPVCDLEICVVLGGSLVGYIRCEAFFLAAHHCA